MSTETVIINGVEYAPITIDSPVKLVVLQRGWNVVGRYHVDGEQVTISDAKVIRRWGTTRGLGELIDGPTSETVLDPAGTVRAHLLGVVLTIDADADAWKAYL